MTRRQWTDSELVAALDALRDAEAHIEAPLHVEDAVLAAWDSAHATSASTHQRSLWRTTAAIAAGVTIVAGLAQLGRQLREVTQVDEAGTVSSDLADQRGTLLLVGEPIFQGEPVRVVRMRVPAATLAGLGVRAAAGDAQHVDVDVIVGEDGVARAIRVGM
jgi:hypothetical protein